MKNRAFVIPVIVLSLAGIILTGCADGGATGRLQVYANGEDFVRQGFVSKDSWSINFDHVYITLADITAYQTDPPYDPHSGGDISGKAAVSLDNVYTVDLADGDENASPILVAEVSGAPAGHYNALFWEMIKASSGPAAGYSLVIIGTAEKDGRSVDFAINSNEECGYSCGEYVGDERRGILKKDGTADLEMTFHFDHIFGDADTPMDDDLNVSAIGFDPFAGGGQVDLDMAEFHLGHVGEGHCYCECN